MKPRIHYTKPSVTELEVSYATDAAANGWGARCYEYIDRFEGAFKKHLGVEYAVATSSCTGALHMGMAALGIGAGDEVILADTNWIATAAPIVHLGARPVFVDILPDTWCIDPKQTELAITKKTKAIIATHLYGNLCDMDALQDIGSRHGVPIIEDSAEAIGSVYSGKHAGSMGIFGAFSFHGTKTITTGEGGMFVTNDRILYDRVLTLSNHGRDRRQEKQFWPDAIGFKYKMSNIQAAIGCGQMERVSELVKRKQEILQEYQNNLGYSDLVSMNPTSAGNVNGAWMPTVVFSKSTGITRERLQAEFRKENIDARVFFWPLSELPLFGKPSKKTGVSHAHDIPRRAINLPSYHEISHADQMRVVAVLRQLLEAL